jgi:hypothetical protein
MVGHSSHRGVVEAMGEDYTDRRDTPHRNLLKFLAGQCYDRRDLEGTLRQDGTGLTRDQAESLRKLLETSINGTSGVQILAQVAERVGTNGYQGLLQRISDDQLGSELPAALRELYAVEIQTRTDLSEGDFLKEVIETYRNRGQVSVQAPSSQATVATVSQPVLSQSATQPITTQVQVVGTNYGNYAELYAALQRSDPISQVRLEDMESFSQQDPQFVAAIKTPGFVPESGFIKIPVPSMGDQAHYCGVSLNGIINNVGDCRQKLEQYVDFLAANHPGFGAVIQGPVPQYGSTPLVFYVRKQDPQSQQVTVNQIVF